MAILVSVGLVLLVATLVDVVWTAVAAGSGAGPLSSRLSRGLWLAALRLHSRVAAPTVLTAAGVIIVLCVLLTWIALVLGGWLLIFFSSDDAVGAATSGVPGDLTDRVYFTGYTFCSRSALATTCPPTGCGSWRRCWRPDPA